MPKTVTGPLVLASSLPLNAAFQSKSIPATGIDTIVMTIETSGATSATGNFKVLGRVGSSGWIDLDISPAIVLSDANISTSIIMSDLAWTEICLSFTPGSGADTGTFTSWLQGEGLN